MRAGAAALLLGAVWGAAAQAPPKGTVDAVYGIVDRVLGASQRNHFALSLGTDCGSVHPPCFSVSASEGVVTISAAPTANELASGLGWYLREVANITIGWPRGGGSRVVVPGQWPDATAVSRKRSAEWSYFMNVCTHSYSLQWYGWKEWENIIDWMALSGINNVLGMTGQEEVQYKVFRSFGLDDEEVRGWFNGPAFLTWSRGQNEYGAGIAGPLPRSFMKDQWDLQRQILQRYRSLGIVAQLPGFQGNVPVALKDKLGDKNITKAGATGWMDSLDPVYAKIADVWMKTLIADFGTDHWYQLDGYFNGGTAPWLGVPLLPSCEWSGEMPGKYLAGCCQKCFAYKALADAQSSCLQDTSCGGITQTSRGYELRAGSKPSTSPGNETSWVITNPTDCRPQPDADPLWERRGAAAYEGLNRTDPDAVWSFQGWAFVGWNTLQQESSLKGFVSAVPQGKFNVIDMSTDGSGEWKKWNNSTFWGAHYIWTTLHDFGGTDGMKGDIDRINEIPFTAPEGPENGGLWGTGFTPEGIDQNPVYYEFMTEQNWRAAPVADVPGHLVYRAHRRYGLTAPSANVEKAWKSLAASAYSQDLSVQDQTGVPHLPGSQTWSFASDRHTPTTVMCQIFSSWELLQAASEDVPVGVETFDYDLVNLGREVLAQLSTPMSMNLSDAASTKAVVNAARVNATGPVYIQTLHDIDTLVQSNQAFLLGPWLQMARGLVSNRSTDCVATQAPVVTDCAHFYEWNARCQITTWNPTTKEATAVPGGPIDYASKHWSGLIRDYYAERASRMVNVALSSAAAGKVFDTAAYQKAWAQLAYSFQVSTVAYPIEPVGNPRELSAAMLAKYRHYFSACG
eukprot:Hpha_TRINITY_DN7710_c0_g1::TRINITY_DN7710_c0_g1_i1::g.85521::m.85521/K01205/NAGLU; alpha-N-acetylglucosaminidase